MDPDISREIFAEAVSLTNTYARGLLQREGMTWGPLPSARNRLEQAMRVGTSGTSAAATPWLLAGRDAGAEAGVEVVSCRGDSRNQNGNPIGRGQISEYLNDATIAAWVERQELTALHGPRREGHPRGLHGPSVDVI